MEITEKCKWCDNTKNKIMMRDVGKYSNKHTIFYAMCTKCKAKSPIRRTQYEVLEDFRK